MGSESLSETTAINDSDPLEPNASLEPINDSDPLEPLTP
jgi:hypothetical protein